MRGRLRLLLTRLEYWEGVKEKDGLWKTFEG